MNQNGKLTHSPDCDEGGCLFCRGEAAVYDPPARPTLKPGEYVVEYQLKVRRERAAFDSEPRSLYSIRESKDASNKMTCGLGIGSKIQTTESEILSTFTRRLRSRDFLKRLTFTKPDPPKKEVPHFDLKRGTYSAFSYKNYLEDFKVHFEDEYDLKEPVGRIVRDRQSYEICVLCLTTDWIPTSNASIFNKGSERQSRPREYLRVFDHEGISIKFDDLAAIFPALPKPTEPPPKFRRVGIVEDTPLYAKDVQFHTPEQKQNVLRTLGKLGYVEVDVAEDGAHAILKPHQRLVDAFEHRREVLRKNGSPTTSTTLFHGTCTHNIPDIIHEGFKLAKHSGGALGPGIYFGKMMKAAFFAKACDLTHFIPPLKMREMIADLPPSNVNIFNAVQTGQLTWPCDFPFWCALTKTEKRRLKFLPRLNIGLECEVLLGKPYHVDVTNDVPGAETPRRYLGRGDSVYCTGFQREEWCIYRPSQVLVRKIVILKEYPPISVPLQ